MSDFNDSDEHIERVELTPKKDVDRKKLALGFLGLMAIVFGLLMFAIRDQEQEAAQPETRTEDPDLRTQAYQRQLDREEQEAAESARRDSLRQSNDVQREQRLRERQGAIDAFDLAPTTGVPVAPGAANEDILRARLAAARAAQGQPGSAPAGPTMSRTRSRAQGRAGAQQQQDPAYVRFVTALAAAPLSAQQNTSQSPRGQQAAPQSAGGGYDASEIDDPFARYLVQRMEEEDERSAQMDREDQEHMVEELAAYQRGIAPEQRQGGGAQATQARSPDEPRSFNERVAEEARSDTYVQAEIVQPLTPYELKSGTVIPAVLITGMSSDLPGDLVAQVSRDVYDSQQQRFLIIPKGSRLLGRYNSDVAFGQTRALVAWTRLVYPDGRSISLPGFNGVDQAGMTGLRDGVDRHLLAAFASAGAIAVLGAGVQLAANSGDSGGFNDQSPQEVIANQIALEISRVATELLERNLDRQPTITVRPGFRFNVFVNRDLALPQPYRDAGTAPRFVRSPETLNLRPPAPRGYLEQEREPQRDGDAAPHVPGGRTIVRPIARYGNSD